MAKLIKTSDGRKGGRLVGPTDKANGKGIAATVIGGRNVVLGGGEVIINEDAARLHCEELNKINQSTGGRAIDCNAKKSANTSKEFKSGGKIENKEFELVFYRGFGEDEGTQDFFSEDKAQLALDRIDQDGGIKTLSARTAKYHFIGELGEEETIEDYPLEDWYKDESVYKLIDEGDYEELSTEIEKSSYELLEIKKAEASVTLADVVKYFEKKYTINESGGLWFRKSHYFIIPIEGTDKTIEMRLSNHSSNPDNIDSKSNIKLKSEIVRRGNKPKEIDTKNEDLYEVDGTTWDAGYVTYYQIRPKNRVALLSNVIFYQDNDTANKFDKTDYPYFEKEYDLSRKDLTAYEIIESIEYEISEIIRTNKANNDTFMAGGSITNTELDKALSDLHKAEKLQKMMKEANAIIRSKKNVHERLVNEVGWSESIAHSITEGDRYGRFGFPTYQLTNNNASIKRLQERVNMLQKKVAGAEKVAQTGEAHEYNFTNHGGGTILVNYDIDRVQILFPSGRVPKELYSDLRSNGWVFSPTNSAFQRKITPQAIHNAVRKFDAKKVTTELEKGVADEQEHLKTLEKVAAGDITPKEAVVEIAQTHIDEKRFPALDYDHPLNLLDPKSSQYKKALNEYKTDPPFEFLDRETSWEKHQKELEEEKKASFATPVTKEKTLGETSEGFIVEYADEEGEIISELERQGEMTTSDAQGVLEAHEEFAREYFGLGFSGREIAKMILDKGTQIQQDNSKPEETAFQGIHHNYKDQYALNKAIEALLTDRTGSYTSDEKNFIRKYSGYGGLDKYGPTGKGGLFEYYTPKEVIEKMWGLAYKYGYNDGSVLEPSIATGEFLQYAPKDVRVVGYEINKFSAEICRILYPTVEMHVNPFEQIFIRNNFTVKDKTDHLEKFDLVIGNPPYGDFSTVESRYMSGMGEKDHTKARNYVEYFIRRGLDLVKPGGLLIYIVGSQIKGGGRMFLDTELTPVKEYLSENCTLETAYRLPDSVFERTGVTADIIVLKKNS